MASSALTERRDALRAAAVDYFGDRSRRAGEPEVPARQPSVRDRLVVTVGDLVLRLGSRRLKALIRAGITYGRLSLYEDWSAVPPFDEPMDPEESAAQPEQGDDGLTERTYAISVCSLCGSDDIEGTTTSEALCGSCGEWMNTEILAVVPLRAAEREEGDRGE